MGISLQAAPAFLQLHFFDGGGIIASANRVDAVRRAYVQSSTVGIVPCNLCGSNRHTFVYEMPDRRFFPQELLKIVECNECGLGFVSPRPSMAEIQKYYPPEYFAQPATHSHDRYFGRRFAEEASSQRVHDPMAYFRKAATVIKKGGLFVFLVTNFESVASRYLFCEDVPRHLYFFTRKTVRRYLDVTGFALEREDNDRNIYKLAPINWLNFMLHRHVKWQKFSFADVPLTAREFRARHNLRRGVRASLKYFAYSPVSVIDKMLWPAIETAQILRKSYGISTYVARKL